MSADIKWEAVEQGDLSAGDKVRLRHRNGDVIQGIFRDGLNLNGWAYVETMGGHLRMSSLGGHTFERAVPGRTLPTEPGIYQGSSALDISGTENATTYRLRWDNTWVNMAYPDMEKSADCLPDDLVRLVPVTEVEELRQRIEKAKARFAFSALDRILDGEA